MPYNIKELNYKELPMMQMNYLKGPYIEQIFELYDILKSKTDFFKIGEDSKDRYNMENIISTISRDIFNMVHKCNNSMSLTSEDIEEFLYFFFEFSHYVNKSYPMSFYEIAKSITASLYTSITTENNVINSYDFDNYKSSSKRRYMKMKDLYPLFFISEVEGKPYDTFLEIVQFFIKQYTVVPYNHILKGRLDRINYTDLSNFYIETASIYDSTEYKNIGLAIQELYFPLLTLTTTIDIKETALKNSMKLLKDFYIVFTLPSIKLRKKYITEYFSIIKSIQNSENIKDALSEWASEIAEISGLILPLASTYLLDIMQSLGESKLPPTGKKSIDNHDLLTNILIEEPKKQKALMNLYKEMRQVLFFFNIDPALPRLYEIIPHNVAQMYSSFKARLKTTRIEFK